MMRAVAIWLLALGVARADMVVLQSSVPEWAPGQVIASGAPVRLPAGAALSLMSQSGEIRAISGPLDGPLPEAAAASGGGAVQVVAELLKSRPQGVAVLGAIRDDADGAVQAATLNPKVDKLFCVAPGERPGIALPPKGAARALMLVGPGFARVQVPPGATGIDWPAALPLVDGKTYTLTLAGAEIGAVVIRVTPAPAAQPGERVAQLAKLGCQRQALALLGSLL